MKLIIAARSSRLSQAQVHEVMGLLPHLTYEVRSAETWGDAHQEASLLTNAKENIFTDALDALLLSGEVDATVNSAKDLPSPLPRGLMLAALTRGLWGGDALVSRGGLTLANLPAGAVVGTSSPLRLKQLREVRPDLNPQEIRGTIEERIQKVDAGEYDALIVAHCALVRLGVTHRISEVLPFEAHPLQGRLAILCRRDRPDVVAAFRPVDERPNLAHDGPLAAALKRLEAAPKKTLYTGLDPKAAGFTAEIVHQPLIQISPETELPEAPPAHDAVLFTSGSAVDHYFRKYGAPRAPIVAIGKATARKITQLGGNVFHVPLQEDSDGVAAYLVGKPWEQVLYPCSDLSDNALHRLPVVKPFVIYRTLLLKPEPLDLAGFSSVVFSSASTVKAFFQVYGAPPERLKLIVFGDKTKDELIARGVEERFIQTRAETAPFQRFRQRRIDEATRARHREHELSADDFIWPIFLVEGRGRVEPIEAMPGVSRRSVDAFLPELEDLSAKGLRRILLFGVPDHKGVAQAWSPDGIVQKAIPVIRKKLPHLEIITDVCLCSFTEDGHCHLPQEALSNPSAFLETSQQAQSHIGGIKHDARSPEERLNDLTAAVLGRIAASHVAAGAHVVAPSDMMDGRVRAIHQALLGAGVATARILSYAAKFASAYYAPFREAAACAPKAGDRKTYQMDPPNGEEALAEIAADLAEGAEAVIVKPALAYLDVIARARDRFHAPIVSYNVSGEYSMLRRAVDGGLMRPSAIHESLVAMKRAGASRIISYFTPEFLNGSIAP